MRIRKNAKLSPLMFSQGSSEAQPLQTHVCQLNQSPWDVISFSQETYYPSSSLYQVSFFVMKCLSSFPPLLFFDRSTKTLPLFILSLPAFPPLLLRVFQISNIRVALKP